jgi:hypothetical protein
VIHDGLIANQYYQEFYQRMQDNGITLGIETKEHDGLTLYPVPCNETLYIKSTKTVKNITVTDLFGRTVITWPGNSDLFKVNTENLSSGIYILKSGNTSYPFTVHH